MKDEMMWCVQRNTNAEEPWRIQVDFKILYSLFWDRSLTIYH